MTKGKRAAEFFSFVFRVKNCPGIISLPKDSPVFPAPKEVLRRGVRVIFAKSVKMPCTVPRAQKYFGFCILRYALKGLIYRLEAQGG
jgi:hypothetical protein